MSRDDTATGKETAMPDQPAELTRAEMIELLKCREMVKRGDLRWHNVVVLEVDQAAAIARALTTPLVPAGPDPGMDTAWLTDLARYVHYEQAAAAAPDPVAESDMYEEAVDYAVALAVGLSTRARRGDITLPDIPPPDEDEGAGERRAG